jgi:hypothetical protein
MMERLLAGKWPVKRNLIISIKAKSIEESAEYLRALRKACPFKPAP